MAVRYRKTQNVPNDSDEELEKSLVTSTIYCNCRDCKKYRANKKPITCIDPYLINMRHTYWIYRGLVTASTTQRAYMNAASSYQNQDVKKDNKGTIKENKTNKTKNNKKPTKNNNTKKK